MPRRKKTSQEDRTPLWVIAGVVLGAMIVYLAMAGGREKEGAGTRGIQTSSAESVALSPVRDGVVIAGAGAPAKNDAPPGSSEAPERSGPLSKDMVPEGAIMIRATRNAFSPSRFEVKKSEPITLALASGDEFTHILAFQDPSLRAIALGVSGGEVRAIRFNAPDEKGEYEFYKDMPGFQNVRGTMVVK